MIAGDRVSPGSVPEVIDDGVTGFVVNDDVEALAAIQLARDYLGHEKLLRDETRRALKLRPHAHEPIRQPAFSDPTTSLGPGTPYAVAIPTLAPTTTRI